MAELDETARESLLDDDGEGAISFLAGGRRQIQATLASIEDARFEAEIGEGVGEDASADIRVAIEQINEAIRLIQDGDDEAAIDALDKAASSYIEARTLLAGCIG